MGRDCRFRIVEASRGADGEAILSEKEAGDLLDEIMKAAENKAQGDIDISEAVAAEIAAKKINMKIEGDIQKRNAAINIIKYKEGMTQIENFVAEGLTPFKAIQAFTVGVQGVYKKGRQSIDLKGKVMSEKYIGGITKEFEANDLLRIVRDKSHQVEIEKELFELSRGKEGVTKSKEALQIAKIIHKYQEATRLRQNRAGANINKLESFTVSQTHDRSAMRQVGYNAWRDKVLPLLDIERTFQGAEPEEFLQSVYQVLTTGISKKTTPDEKLFEFKGPANLAKKISRSRVLHFKDAESSIAYRNEFGKKDFMEGVMQGLDAAARNIALMESLGTNPKAMFYKILEDLKKKYRGDEARIKDLVNDRMLRNYYDEVSGDTMIPESPRMAQIGSFIRALQSMSKMGGLIISALSDVPLKAAELQFQGRNILDSYGVALGDIRLVGKQRRQLGLMIGAYSDAVSGSIAARWTAQDDLSGTMSKLQRLFFKLNLQQWWDESQKFGTSIAMSSRLASFKKLPFDKLDVDTKRLFGNYGITDKDWEVIRSAAIKEVDGREYITADLIQDAAGLTQKQKDDIEDKLRGYFIDRVEHATLTPGARERGVLNLGLKRGTVEGELIRMIMQFKTFPSTVISKVYGRSLYGKGKADIPALIQTSIAVTLFGYISMSGKDLLKGREPRPLDQSSAWKAAFLQGGGAGILGDFLLGEYNRFGKGFTTTLAGPTFTTADNIASTVSAAMHGEDASAKAVSTIINNTPFANLFYLRPVLNHMFIYQLQETVNPGYLRRMERRIEKENNQKFLIKPSDVVR